MKNRLYYLDISKGIGMLMVMYGHCLMIGESDVIFKLIYGCHMALFFIISGILIGKKAGKVDLVKMIKKYLIYFYIFTVVNEIAEIVNQILQNELVLKDELLRFGLKLIFVKDSCGMWFLSTLMFSQCLFVWLNKIQNKKVFNIINFLFFIFSLFIPKLPFNMITNVLYRIVYAYLFILLGYKFYDVIDKFRYKNYIVITLLLNIVYLFSVFFNSRINLAESVIGNPFLFYLSSVVGTYLIICMSKIIENKDNFLKNFLTLFGRESIIVFGTHMIFIKIIRYLIKGMRLNIYIRNFIILGICVMFELLLLKVYLFIKKKKEKEYEKSK